MIVVQTVGPRMGGAGWGAAGAVAEVFWFFFSKKNRFPYFASLNGDFG
jgi:hypothetical protein